MKTNLTILTPSSMTWRWSILLVLSGNNSDCLLGWQQNPVEMIRYLEFPRKGWRKVYYRNKSADFLFLDEMSSALDQSTLSTENALEKIGSFGKFQKRSVILLSITGFALAFQAFIMFFVILESKWKCTKNSSVCYINGTLGTDDLPSCQISRDQWY